MPAIYVYSCPDHGRFEISLRFGSDVPTTWECPHWLSRDVDMAKLSEDGRVPCLKNSKRVILPPVGVTVKGGTGGGKDMHSR